MTTGNKEFLKQLNLLILAYEILHLEHYIIELLHGATFGHCSLNIERGSVRF
ncbi:MAG: hypothetical protein U5K79_05870 [Cyclobacteriaceae bacterium]|nr:hypothetical protein [Cyclobacteriaceae bacterium]